MPLLLESSPGAAVFASEFTALYIVYWDYTGITKKKMETLRMGLYRIPRGTFPEGATVRLQNGKVDAVGVL